MSTTPKPPAHLSAPAKKLWHKLHGCHAIDDEAGLLLLNSVCSAFDRAEAARQILATEGLVVKGRQGPRVHPCAQLEHNARQQMLSAMKSLKLSPGDAP